jgi:hypothetical protein
LSNVFNKDISGSDDKDTSSESGVSWPVACVGCGKTDSENLKSYDYEWTKEVTTPTYPSRTTTTTKMGVKVHLCPSCLSEAEKRNKRPLIITGVLFLSLLVISIAVPIIMVLNFGEFQFEPLRDMVLYSLIVAVPFVIFYQFANRKFYPFYNYMGISKLGFMSDEVKVTFKNRTYYDLFRSTNSQVKADHNPNFRGHFDLIDQNIWIGSICVFGILLSWAMPYIIDVLFG